MPDRRPEIRWHLGRRRHAHRQRGAAHRRHLRAGPQRLRRRLGARRHDRRAPALAYEISPDPPEREMDMLLSTGERISCALLAMAIDRLGKRGGELHGLAGGHHHRRRARQGTHPRHQRLPRAGGARPRPDRAGRGLPGRLHRARRSPRSAAAARHDRRRPGARAGRRGLRDLHRRRGRLHRQPEPRGQARKIEPSPTTRCSRWRPPAPRSSPCARSSTRASTTSRSTCARASRRRRHLGERGRTP